MRVTVDDRPSPPAPEDVAGDGAEADASDARSETHAKLAALFGPKSANDPVTQAARERDADDAAEPEPEPDAAEPDAAEPEPDAAELDAVEPDAVEHTDDSTRENPIIVASEPTEPAEPTEPTEPEIPASEWADETRPPTALTWLDAQTVTATSALREESDDDLLTDAHLVPGWLRPRVIVPLGVVAVLCGSYVGATLLWPLDAVAPVVKASTVELTPAPAAAITWPTTGSAAVAVSGLDTVASTTVPTEIASITKVASTMMVLDELPLEPGEQGPAYTFDWSDSRDYWSYRWSNQSALDVPVGGSLSEYQMLQGVLLGSANNYIDRMSDELWGSDAGFAEASKAWLAENGIEGVSLATPSGFDTRNVSTPAGLIELGEVAMRNPVFAEIVGTESAQIPGAGEVTNSNGMLEDPGVVGIKTGTLSGWNLLTAKDVEVDGTTVRLFAAVLGQDGDDERLAATRSLFTQVEEQLAAQEPTVPAGTVVGTVRTEWGAQANLVTDADAEVVLWNSAAATSESTLELGEDTTKGAEVGTLTLAGPVNQAETTVSLDAEIPAPSAWWRLTHPLELFGLDGR